MTIGRGDALEQALALYRAPTRSSLLQEFPPDDVLLLLRIAANDRSAIDAAVRSSGLDADAASGAALLYIQHVLFADSADAYRLLGVHPDADAAQIKEHYRWLMRWLHPDRQPERWEVVYSDRVNLAWQALRSEQHRAAYDVSLRSFDVREQRDPQSLIRRNVVRKVSKPLLSPRIRRRLPTLILGGLALGAFIVLGVIYDSREDISSPLPASPTRAGTNPPHNPVAQTPVLPIATVLPGVSVDPAVAESSATNSMRARSAQQVADESDRHAPGFLANSFTHAYAAGDIAALTKLFDADVVGDRGGLNAIMQEYADLFRETSVRELHLQRLTWTTKADRVVGSGPFDASIQWRGEPTARHIDGWITIEAGQTDGQWRIQRIVRRNTQ